MKLLTLALLCAAILAVFAVVEARRGGGRNRYRHHRPSYNRYRYRHRHHHHDKDEKKVYIYYPYANYPYSYYPYSNYYYYNGQWYLRTKRSTDDAQPTKIPNGLERFACAKRGVSIDPRPEFKTEWGVCSKNWIYCSAPDAEPVMMTCPADLRYDADAEGCFAQLHIYACSGDATVDQETERFPRDEEGNLLPTTTSAQPTPAPDGFCAELEDGLYPLSEGECSPEYVACTNEEGVLLTCAKGSAFDSEFDRCEYTDELPVCGGERLELRDDRAAEDVPLEPEFTCEQEGIVVDPHEDKSTQWGVCSNVWFYCAAVDLPALKMSCPADLYYDFDSDACLNKKEVFACTGEKIETPKEALVKKAEKPEEPKKEQSVNDFCASEADGNYEWNGRCSEYFVICRQELGYLITCPGLTRYNPDKNECVPQKQCK